MALTSFFLKYIATRSPAWSGKGNCPKICLIIFFVETIYIGCGGRCRFKKKKKKVLPPYMWWCTPDPYLCFSQEAPRTVNNAFEGSALIKACGKLELLSKMLRHIYGSEHRVLIFSQVGWLCHSLHPVGCPWVVSDSPQMTVYLTRLQNPVTNRRL